jgi:hypothetical protein
VHLESELENGIGMRAVRWHRVETEVILGFTGTKRGQTQRQRAAVRYLFAELGVTELHHGDCIGSDAQADCDIYARTTARVVIHPPEDDKLRALCHGKRTTILPARSYLERNMDIAKDGVDGLIATPKEFEEVQRSGTWSTIRRARKLGRHIWIVFPDGTFREETYCRECGKETSGFDERGSLCTSCALVKALDEGDE